jgi:prolyl 4-hydroxylase
MAAGQGDTTSALHLAGFHAGGLGGPQDWTEAVGLLVALGNAGHVVAQREIALLWLMAGNADLCRMLMLEAARPGRPDAGGDALAKALVLSDYTRLAGSRSAAVMAARLVAAGVPVDSLSLAPLAGSRAAMPDRDTMASALVEALGGLHVGPSEALSTRMRVESVPGALHPALCDYLILNAHPLLAPAQITDPKTGARRADPWRTGRTASFGPLQQTPVMGAIRQLLCTQAGADLAQAEPLSVIAYDPGEEYRPHFDAFLPEAEGGEPGAFADGGQRYFTALVQLNSGFSGGETVFPELGLSVAPMTGRYLGFSNVDGAGVRNPLALHAGAPVMSGRKFMASLWIRERERR